MGNINDGESCQDTCDFHENDGNGNITVIAVLDCDKYEYLKGTKINLYEINGLSPVLIDSKITDELGKVDFFNVANGCYRVINIVDRRYFEKPKYVDWNEITIDNTSKNYKIVVINKIKKNVQQQQSNCK